MLVQKFLGLVDLGCEIRTPASIGMVGKHKLAMLLAHLVLGKSSLTIYFDNQQHNPWNIAGAEEEKHTATPESKLLHVDLCVVRILYTRLFYIPIHRKFNEPLVESFSHAIYASLVATKGNQTSATLRRKTVRI